MNFYTKSLSIANQYLIWTIYVRPYYLYIASLLGSQTKSIKEQYHRNWRISFKDFLGIPKNADNSIISFLIRDTKEIEKFFQSRNINKIEKRFNLGNQINPLDQQFVKNINLKLLPTNFLDLFRYGRYECFCHSRHLVISVILEHRNLSLNNFMALIQNL